MHILIIHQIFVTPDNGGGTRHYELAKHLVQIGHKVSVIASQVDYLSGKKRDKKIEIKDGISIYYTPVLRAVHKSFTHRALAFLSFSISSFFLAIKVRDVDIIIGTSPPLFQSVTAYVISKIKRAPFIFEVRDLWLDFAKDLKVMTNPLVFRILKMLETFLYKYCCRIMVNSPGFIKFIEKAVPLEKIFLIPNGVDVSDFESINSDSIDRLKAKLNPENHFVIMYTGNIGVANDIESIIETAARVEKDYPDILFQIVGGGIKKEELLSYCKNNNIGNIEFLAPFPKKKIGIVIKTADICLATLKNIELFKTVYPNKVFDYMAAGKPVITAIDGVIRDVVEDAECGQYVEPGNIDSYINGIVYYYKNRDNVVRHGHSGYLYVKENFNRKFIAQKLDKELKNAL
jgi:glycosyltransferase involved in cell wall biosynthesis